MDLRSLLQVVRRNIVPLVIGLVISSIGVTYMGVRLPTTYTAQATVLLLPPNGGGSFQPAPATPSPGSKVAAPQPVLPPKIYNPYLSFDHSETLLGQIIAAAMTTDQEKAVLASSGAVASYDITVGAAAPTLNVTVIGTDPQEVMATMSSVVGASIQEVTDRQKATGVPKDTWVTASALQVPAAATPTASRRNTLLAATALALVACLSLVFIAESVKRPRLLALKAGQDSSSTGVAMLTQPPDGAKATAAASPPRANVWPP